jgi:hypothetical protein
VLCAGRTTNNFSTCAEKDAKFGPGEWGTRRSVMEEFIRCLHVLHDRISQLRIKPNTTVRYQDSHGYDLSLHIGIAQQILGALTSFFLRDGAFSRGNNSQHDSLVEYLTALMPDLYGSLHVLELEEHANALRGLEKVLQRHFDIILPQVNTIVR